MATTMLQIPEQFEHTIPCRVNPALYTDPALDVDFDDDEFLTLDHEVQQARLADKAAAEARAVAECATCPILDKCREWAMSADVFGVAGGLTENERLAANGHVIAEVVTDATQRGPLGQVRDDLIEKWSELGFSDAEIAERLDCSPNTVKRRRARLAAGTGVRYGADTPALLPVATRINADGTKEFSASQAKTGLDRARLSEETLAIYEALADGAMRDRETIIAAAVPHVDPEIAERWGSKGAGANRSAAERRVAGARKFVLNRIDIAIRRGRIVETKTDSGTRMLRLSEKTAKEVRSWNAKAA